MDRCALKAGLPKQLMELDVEAVEELGVGEAPELVLYGGKGGVGKTTMAAATGLASAADGVETLVVSTDPAHSLSDMLDTRIAAEPTTVHSEYPLYAVEIDPDRAMEESAFFQEDGGLEGLLGGGFGDDMSDGLGGMVPGADEAAAIQQLLRFVDDARFDRVIIDTAPTGHTLRLLELPDVLDSFVGRIMTLRDRLGGVVDSVTGMFGDDEPDEVNGDDLEVFRERIERLRSVLRDPDQTDFRIVMVPELLSVEESERLLSRLAEFGIPVETIVVNRVMESLSSITDVEGSVPEPNLDSCTFCQRRWQVQQDALARAQDVFRGHAIKRVPLFADEIRGEQMLRLVAACLQD